MADTITTRSTGRRARRGNPNRIRRNLTTKRESEGVYRVLHGGMQTGFTIHRNDAAMTSTKLDPWTVKHDETDYVALSEHGRKSDATDNVARRIANEIPRLAVI